jgi:hypothetical protein
MKVLALLLGATALLFAQETRREVTNPATNPADDTKALSPSVPDVYAIHGQFQRITILRFKYKSDLLAGLEKMVKEEKIKNAVVLSAAGSVTGYQVHQVSNREFPSKNTLKIRPRPPT